MLLVPLPAVGPASAIQASGVEAVQGQVFAVVGVTVIVPPLKGEKDPVPDEGDSVYPQLFPRRKSARGMVGTVTPCSPGS
jgi:hypothetical protein